MYKRPSYTTQWSVEPGTRRFSSIERDGVHPAEHRGVAIRIRHERVFLPQPRQEIGAAFMDYGITRVSLHPVLVLHQLDRTEAIQRCQAGRRRRRIRGLGCQGRGSAQGRIGSW